MSELNNRQDRDKQQKIEKTESPQALEGDQKKSASAWKRFLGKRWVFPAAYLIAAAIILSLMWAYQGILDRNPAEVANGGPNLTEGASGEAGTEAPDGEDSLPAAVPSESMAWPVADPAAVEVVTPFFDVSANQEAKQAAIIQNGNEFYASMGISLARQDQQGFDVLAAMSGTVTRAEQLPLVGYVVEIFHGDGLSTYYQSLENVTVSVGDEVRQGQVIAQAGRNELEKDLGVHLHFEVRENDVPVNPNQYLPRVED